MMTICDDVEKDLNNICKIVVGNWEKRMKKIWRHTVILHVFRAQNIEGINGKNVVLSQ